MGQTTEYIDLRARDHTRKGVESAKKNFAGLQKQVKAARASMAGIAAAAAVAGLAKLTKNTLDAADAVEKLGRRTGASARFLSEMQFGLSQSGITSEKFADALKDMNKNAIDAAKGTGMQAEAMQRLGVDSKAFLKLNTDQKFITLAEAISKMEDPAMRSHTAMALFGESGQQLQTILEGGAAGIQAYREEAVKLGQSLSEDQVKGAAAANDALDRLSKSISGAFQQSILQSSASITKFAAWMETNLPRIINGVIAVLETLGTVVSSVFSVFGSVVDVFSKSSAAVVDHKSVLAELTGATGEQLKAQKDSIEARIREIEQDDTLRNARGRLTQAAQAELEVLKQKLPIVQSQLAQTRVGISLAIDEAKARLRVAEANYAEAKARKENTRTGRMSRAATVQLNNAMDALTEAQKGVKAEQARLIEFDEKLRKSREQINNVMSTGATVVETVKEKTEELTQATVTLTEAHEVFADALPKTPTENYNEALREIRDAVHDAAAAEYLIKRALDEGKISKEEAIKLAERLGVETRNAADETKEATGILAQSWEDASSSIFSSLEQFWRDGLDGWDSFADSIKNTVKDMVASILAQITRLIASNAFNKFLSFISGGKLGSDKGLFDGLGQLLGGSSGSNPAADAVKDAAPDAVKEIFNSGFGATIKKGATAAWSTITKGASAVWGGVKTAATWLSSGAKTLIAAIPGWGQAALAAVAVFAGLRKIFGGGARSFSEIVEEDYKPDLVGVKAGQAAGNNTAVFGANWGISGTGITSQHLVDGGENGNGGFFHGAKQNLDEFAELLRQNGLEAKMAGGLLRVLSRDGSKTTADIKRLWQEYANGLTSAVEYSAVFKTAIEENHLKPTNLFFEQFALGFGQSYFEARDAMEKIRVETQKMVASGIDQTKAFTKAFTDFYGIAESDAMRFFNETGISIDKMAEQFATMSADSLQALTEFNDDGVTQLEQLVKGAETAATGVRDAFSGVLNGVDLGTPRDTVVTSQVNATETGAYLGAYNRGGSFIVPGNGNSDQPYRIDLTPGERVTVEPDTLTSKAIPTDGGEGLIDAVYMLIEQLATSDRNTQRMTALARGQKQNDRI